MKKVITYGTFDLLHKGHVNLLQEARKLGDYLIVAVSTDGFNSIKGKNASYVPWEDRKYILEALTCVDEVIPEMSWEQKIADIRKNDIKLFVMGDDWEGEFDYLKEYCDVEYIKRTVGISTTKIKIDLKSGSHNQSKIIV